MTNRPNELKYIYLPNKLQLRKPIEVSDDKVLKSSNAEEAREHMVP